MCQSTRRGFLVGCSTAIASLAGSRFNSFAFAQGGAAGAGGGSNDEILVVLFLRGGQDGLNLIVPTGGASNDRQFYEQARPNLRVPITGEGAALPLGNLGGTSFGMHPSAAPLHELFQDGKLAVVTACGMAANERSHFDSMNWMELGTPGVSNISDGWLTRHRRSPPSRSPLFPRQCNGPGQRCWPPRSRGRCTGTTRCRTGGNRALLPRSRCRSPRRTPS